MRSFTPDTNAEVLEWARKVLGLRMEDAARQIGVDRIVLEMWEVGAESPTYAQLRRMAEVYKKPVATLLMSNIPKGESPITTNFRLLPQNQRTEWSPELRLAMWRVQLQQDVAREIAERREETPPPLDLQLRLDDDTEEAGTRVRDWLGPPARSPDDARRTHDLTPWNNRIEAKSILVTQTSFVPLEEMRGVSISEEPFPVIVLNGYDSPRGKVFTLMHELVHILLHRGGLCDLEDKRALGSNDKERVERFCNEVAAVILMPRALVLGDWRVAQASSTTKWRDKDLVALAANFGVSREALLRRLVSLGRAPRDLYAKLRPHYQLIYEEQQKEKEQRGGAEYYKQKIRNFGRRYVTTVLDAYHQDDITPLEVADYLDMKISNLQDLEERLGAGP